MAYGNINVPGLDKFDLLGAYEKAIPEGTDFLLGVEGEELIRVPADAVGGGNYNKQACVVVGTSTSGHTLDDCDYLCDGVNDQEEIQSAIDSTKYSGGAIISFLPGTYSLGSTPILLQNDHDDVNYLNYTFQGIGPVTIELKNFSDAFLVEAAHDSVTLPVKDVVYFKNITFKNSAVGGGYPNAIKVDTKNISGLSVGKVIIYNCVFYQTSVGGYVYSCAEPIIVNCEFYGGRISFVGNLVGTVKGCKFSGEPVASLIVSAHNVIGCEFTYPSSANSSFKGAKVSGVAAFNLFRYVPNGIECNNNGATEPISIFGNRFFLPSTSVECKCINVYSTGYQPAGNMTILGNVCKPYTSWASNQYSIYIDKNISPPSSGTAGVTSDIVIVGNVIHSKGVTVVSGVSRVYHQYNY